MQTFYTEFPVGPECNLEKLIFMGIEWIVGSPHSEIPEEIISEIDGNKCWARDFGSEQVEVNRAFLDGVEIGGVKYCRNESNGLSWETTVVGEKTESGLWVGIRISCETSNLGTKVPPPKKPYIIKQIFQQYGGGKDGEISVSDQPIELKNSDVALAKRILSGESGATLPIVYVSAPFNNKKFINSSELATWLSGMAHVVVEPNRSFSIRLMDEVNQKNVYGGIIGIYWANGSGGKRFYIDRGATPDGVRKSIHWEVKNALAIRRSTRKCTWSHVSEASARETMVKLKADGSTALQSYINTFDAEIKAKEALLKNAENEISRLFSEIRRLEAVEGFDAEGGILENGTERDLYPGERHDLVLMTLEDALPNVVQGSRRQHIISDIVKDNKKIGSTRKMEAELKSLLRTYKEMDARSKARFEELGFSIGADGKHYKAIFREDPRYTFILPKTSSDVRAGKNCASDISKILF